MNAGPIKIKIRITKRNLRQRCRARGLTVTQFAKLIGRSKPAVYFALERPSRFGPTYKLIQDQLA